MTTTYLPPVTDTPAIGTIDHSAGYLAGATSIVVTTLQGTFPAPAAGQAFVAIVNPNTSGLLDNATTERCIVTVNASGTWTIPAGLAFNHANGENVAIVVSTTWLDALASLASPAFTGTPTAPTAPPLTDDTQIATTAYTDAAVTAAGGAAAAIAAQQAQTALNLFLSTQCS